MEETFDDIIESIFMQLNGNAEHDMKLLMESAEQYKDHEYSTEIVRAIGRKVYEVMPDDAKEKLEQVVGNHEASSTSVLDEALLAMQKGDTDRALSIIEPYAHKLEELHESGLCKEDAVSIYFDFDNVIQYIYVAETLRTDKEIRHATEPFANTFGMYAGLLFDVGRHEEAIEWLRKAIKWNPAQTQFYYEIATNYKKLGDLNAALEAGGEAFAYIMDAQSLARWYRERGFIAIEQGQLRLAAAEFRYSNIFEESPLAMSEIMYIRQEYGEDYTGMGVDQAVTILEEYEMPLNITPYSFGLLAAIYRFLVEQEDIEAACKLAFDLYGLSGDDEWRDNFEALRERLQA